MFVTIEELRSAFRYLPEPDETALARAKERQAQLTKPPGSLGRLEDIACFLAGWQKDGPCADRIDTLVFAGNHGVTAQSVSPYPAEVTAQMVANFERGGAAINALCRAGRLNLKVVAIDLDRPTCDFTQEEAMSEAEFLAAFNTGAGAVDARTDIIAVGEMGIGNSTAAAALAAATFGGTGSDWAGAGTGLDAKGVIRKAQTIDRALVKHAKHRDDPLAFMRALGGRELAAIAGAVTRAREASIPVLLDGFIATAAVAPLVKLHTKSLSHCLAAHRSSERAHGRLLELLGLEPLLDLGLRLGEASGAALAASIVRAAAALHREMSTFVQAGVSNVG